MKIIVKTTGAFMLIDPYTGNQIEAGRPSVVTPSPFLESRTTAGQVKVLETDLPDEALDADFVEFWNENPESAVDAFISAFGEVEAPAKKGKAKPKEDKKEKKEGEDDKG